MAKTPKPGKLPARNRLSPIAEAARSRTVSPTKPSLPVPRATPSRAVGKPEVPGDRAKLIGGRSAGNNAFDPNIRTKTAGNAAPKAAGTAGLKAAGKVAARALPYVGAALTAWELGKAAKDALADGKAQVTPTKRKPSGRDMGRDSAKASAKREVPSATPAKPTKPKAERPMTTEEIIRWNNERKQARGEPRLNLTEGYMQNSDAFNNVAPRRPKKG